MTYDSKGFTLIELLIVVVIIGLLAAIGCRNLPTGKSGQSSRPCGRTCTTSWEHRRGYFSNGQTYYNGPLPNVALPYSISAGGTVTLSSVTPAGWAATATHSGSTRTCAIFVGSAVAPAPAVFEGQVACTP